MDRRDKVEARDKRKKESERSCLEPRISRDCVYTRV